MNHNLNWDWETPEKRFAVGAWRDTYGWVEEPYVSPDGEKIAAIVRLEDETFSVCVNGDVWPSSFEKIWHLRFAPDGRLTALVCDEMEWTLAVDGPSSLAAVPRRRPGPSGLGARPRVHFTGRNAIKA